MIGPVSQICSIAEMTVIWCIHNTIPLLEDAYLNHSAQTLANHLAQNGFNPQPDFNKSYGENISVSFTNQPLSKSLTKSNKFESKT